MRAFGCWISSLGIPVVHNIRWGTEETYEYCFDGINTNGIVAIGTVASGIKKLCNRSQFDQGFKTMCKLLKPSTIIIYGSSNLACITEAAKSGINIITFESETNQAFKRGNKHE